MKTSILNLSLIALLTSLIASGCKKQIDIKDIEKDIKNDNSCSSNCKSIAFGNIHSCRSNATIWYIVATDPTSSFAPPTQILLAPDNLPNSFKIDGLKVNFKYNLLPDSVELNCGWCGTVSGPYGRKIKLCEIEKDTCGGVMAFKPVIYLYPQKETKIQVRLNYEGTLTVTYPEINKHNHQWHVIAQANGDIKNLSDNTQHNYLFWEGTPSIPYSFNMMEGYCIKGSETSKFLQTILPKLGLTPKEYNDMIVFWLPKMINNPFNLIHFAKEEYTKSAVLKISPKPDNILRIFMVIEPTDKFIVTQEPTITTTKRTGFTVVEWGGTEMPKNYSILIP